MDPKILRKEMEALPPVLRALLEAELAAGNAVVEIGHSHPAPPVGAYFKLASPLLTRARAAGDGLEYRRRDNSLYSGEITDARRFHFLLEPPEPPPPGPDMDAIRRRHEPTARQTSDAPPPAGGVVARFVASMEIDYEKWHDGIGYDLAAITEASPAERSEIEAIVLRRGARDWRDVEALAKLDTRATREALKEAVRTAPIEIRVAVLDHARGLVSDRTRTEVLVEALETADFFGGLTTALRLIAGFHPPEVIAALFHGARFRNGGPAVQFSALLLFLHGRAPSAFDWAQRPFFLRFNTTDRAERDDAFLELCEKIGTPARRFADEVRKERDAGRQA